MILVIAEQRDGVLNRASWEADRRGAGGSGSRSRSRCSARDVAALAAELAAAAVDEVLTVEAAGARAVHGRRLHPGAGRADRRPSAPALVLCRPHLPGARRDAARRGAPRSRARHRLHRRQAGPAGARSRGRCSRRGWSPTSCRRGRRRTSSPSSSARIASTRSHAATRRPPCAPVAVTDRRRRRFGRSPKPPFREAKQAVDLTQAERIVSVGRGIKGEEHIALARRAGRGARRRARGVAADLRRRLAADGSPGRQLGPDRRARSSISRSASPAPSSTSSA